MHEQETEPGSHGEEKESLLSSTLELELFDDDVKDAPSVFTVQHKKVLSQESIFFIFKATKKLQEVPI